MGQTKANAEASDYSSGDFYGGKRQHRFSAKVFDAFTSHRPFEFMTSRCVNLYDHISTKSVDELFLSSLTSVANGGAYFFIDAIPLHTVFLLFLWLVYNAMRSRWNMARSGRVETVAATTPLMSRPWMPSI